MNIPRSRRSVKTPDATPEAITEHFEKARDRRDIRPGLIALARLAASGAGPEVTHAVADLADKTREAIIPAQRSGEERSLEDRTPSDKPNAIDPHWGPGDVLDRMEALGQPTKVDRMRVHLPEDHQ